jgi:glutamate-1-semialdehyde 2,1-aminomutase
MRSPPAQALAAAEQVNDNAMEAMDAIIREYELPAHTVGFGVKGAVTWSPTPIRNYRDYKLSTDFEAAELGWLWGINRGVLTPPHGRSVAGLAGAHRCGHGQVGRRLR